MTGGVAGVVGRAFAQKLNEAEKTAVVENKTGGAIAAVPGIRRAARFA